MLSSGVFDSSAKYIRMVNKIESVFKLLQTSQDVAVWYISWFVKALCHVNLDLHVSCSIQAICQVLMYSRPICHIDLCLVERSSNAMNEKLPRITIASSLSFTKQHIVLKPVLLSFHRDSYQQGLLHKCKQKGGNKRSGHSEGSSELFCKFYTQRQYSPAPRGEIEHLISPAFTRPSHDMPFCSFSFFKSQTSPRPGYPRSKTQA